MTKVLNCMKTIGEVLGRSIMAAILVTAPIGAIFGGVILTADGQYGLGFSSTFCGILMIYRFFKDRKTIKLS